MSRYYILLILFLFSLSLWAQNVTNVRGSQEGQNIILLYDLAEDARISEVLIDINGKNRVIPASCLSGDVNKTVAKGTDRRIVYDVLLDYTDGLRADNVAFVINAGPQTFTVNGVSFKMVVVEGGTFTMEDPSRYIGYYGRTHLVTLSDFSIGETEVTQELWQAVMGKNPSGYTKHTNLPVESVSWNDCQEFIRKLNQLTGKNFRLPTEAEWEYAARGGNKSKDYKFAGGNNLNNVGWHNGNSSETHLVKQLQPNELGLYDMSGNVEEWCQDWYGAYSRIAQTNPTGPVSGDTRVYRGGSYHSDSRGDLLLSRGAKAPSNGDYSLGLRLVLSNSMDDAFEPMELTEDNSVKTLEDIEVDDSTPIIHPNTDGTQTFIVKGVSFKMVGVEGSIFTMGATSEQGGGHQDERPIHLVTLSDFSIGETEVTQDLWQAVMGSNPSRFEGTNLPVESVSWNDCQEFIRKLNQLTGKNFRLPTEAEWEYAARGGKESMGYRYAGSDTLNNVAYGYDYRSSDQTHPVKQKQPNELGLYDMSGNIWEWCQDWYGSYSDNAQTNPTGSTSGSNRVIRGGSWDLGDKYCRVSIRGYWSPMDRHYSLGFRLVLSNSMDEALEPKELTEDNSVKTMEDIEVDDSNSTTNTSNLNADDTQTFTVKGVSFKMVAVEAGTFTMGATSEQDVYSGSDEKPTHSVTLSNFMIGETEVTQELWKAVMGNNPSNFLSDDLPVENVSWNDCQTFITKLNQLTGKNFRFPTEAEWEYAARGGNKSKGHKYAGGNTLNDVAWYASNGSSKTHPVKQKKPNELGLYDMSGNVSEWCQDWYDKYSRRAQTNPTGPSTGSSRVHRGGRWSGGTWYSRVSFRGYYAPTNCYYDLGLRLVLSDYPNGQTADGIASVINPNSEEVHEYVDLGLSVKWATCNVGANKPEGYGDYFAWGETKPKDCYSSSNYSYKSNPTTLPMSADAARVNWGGSWRMPTGYEQDELRIQCTWTWTTQNGVNGYKVTSKKNGKSIFLPAAGYRYGGGSPSVTDSAGDYWSSSLAPSNPNKAYYLCSRSDLVSWGKSSRSWGHSVRPVCP